MSVDKLGEDHVTMPRFLSLIVLGGLALAVACATSGENCELNSDCLAGYCRDGQCVQDCVDATKDCPKGYLCNTIGQCEFAGTGATGGAGAAGTGGEGGAGASSAGGEGGTSTLTTDTTTNGTTTSTGGGPPGTDPLLTPCGSDASCDSGMCRAMSASNPFSRCTQGCASNAQCPTGLRCEEVGGETYCAESDVGQPCNAAGQCNFACLSPLNYCTSSCSTAADCPNGFGCLNVGMSKVCARAGPDCADGSTCPSACDSSPNMVVSGCTLSCVTAADCPQRALGLPAWTCDGFCRRPGDVYGPLPGGYEPAQWACNSSGQVVNVCGDGLHIDFDNFVQPPPPSVNCSSPFTTDGLPGDACLDSCRYQGGCPFAFGCAAVAEIGGQRIGLCMPRGSGEVGTACTNDGHCAFGVCDAGSCSRDCSRDGICPAGSSCQAQGGPNVEGLPFRLCK